MALKQNLSVSASIGADSPKESIENDLVIFSMYESQPVDLPSSSVKIF